METLDKFDITILAELQSDARLTNAELASRVGLSAAPCWRRVRALEQAGFIKGYRAEIDRRKLPEVVSCHYISGAGTFELQVVSKDLESFSLFARKVLINLPNVKDLHTSFSLGEVKASSALPLNHLK